MNDEHRFEFDLSDLENRMATRTGRIDPDPRDEKIARYENAFHKLGLADQDVIDIALSARAFPLVTHPQMPIHIAMLDVRLRTHHNLGRLYATSQLIDDDYHADIGESALAISEHPDTQQFTWNYLTAGASRATRWLCGERACIVGRSHETGLWGVEIQW